MQQPQHAVGVFVTEPAIGHLLWLHVLHAQQQQQESLLLSSSCIAQYTIYCVLKQLLLPLKRSTMRSKPVTDAATPAISSRMLQITALTCKD